MKLYLVGLMGCGKTTVGRMLSKVLNARFIDTDIQIATAEGKSINEIFNTVGEEQFRRLEHLKIKEIAECEDQNLIVSTGGGTPCYFDNQDIMNNSGVTVYLKRSAELLSQRLVHGQKNRPLINGLTNNELEKFLEQQLAERERFYSKSQITVDCDRMSDAGAVALIERFLTNTKY